MTSDQLFALQQLTRSYALQIEYLDLLVTYGMLAEEAARREIEVVRRKMDLAAERICQLRLMARSNGSVYEIAIHPKLIPDLQFI